MEVDQVSGVLHSILSPDELGAIPEPSLKKIESACEKKFEEYLTAKALFETTKTDLEMSKTEYEKQIEQLTLKAEDEAAKYHSSQLSVKEMRIEMEDVKQELIKTKEKLSSYEIENDRFRKERNQALTERDAVDSALKRKELEVDRLHQDVLELEKKLKTANVAKCEALARLDEIVSKEHSLEFKERRMEQELSMRDQRIARLTQDLDQALREQQAARRDQNIKSLTVETKLSEKNEELKIANQTNTFLSDQNTELSAKIEELATKNMKLRNEMSTMMEHYRKELDSQNRLCELLQQDKQDHVEQTKELESAITSLRQMLNEATESYGTLETEKKQVELKHEEELAIRDKSIVELQEELKRANELLAAAREENIEHAVEKIAPSAAATSRMLKTGMSLTEVYTQYVRTMEMLQQEQKENGKLKLQLQNILQELEQSAPEITRQQTENQNLKEANEEITIQLNNLIKQSGVMHEEVAAVREKLRVVEAENKNFRQERADLSRQICHLLNEIEKMQNGVISQDADQSFGGTSDSGEIISKKLVTFANIQELQNNNVKLLLVVRDFSNKLDEMEKVQNSMSAATYEAKIEACNKRINELKDTVEKHRNLLEQCSQQRDRYKKMYHDAMRSYNPAFSSTSMNGDNAQSDTLMDGLDEMPLANSSTANDTNGGNNSSSNVPAIVAEKERKISALESTIQDLQKELGGVKQEYEAYRREKLTNDKAVNEQFDKFRTEIRELTANNVKLMGTNEFNAEQNRMISKNITTYKNQIAALEERNRNYEGTIAKQEASIMYLKEEAMSAQSKLGRAEVQLENLKQECRILKDSESRLQTERELLNRERCNQNLLLNNLEMIKVSMERSENEGRQRLESRLDETSRECSALRRRLQEEQDRFREQTAYLQRQVETAQKRMDEEIAIAEGHQTELREARDELEIKSRKIDDLQRKLQESLSPNDNDNPVTQARRKIRELEQSLAEKGIEVESLQEQLATAQQHIDQYAKLSESAEKELKDLTELYNSQKQTSEKELAALRKSEEETRAVLNEVQTKLLLRNTNEQVQQADKQDAELHQVQLDLKNALEQIDRQNTEMRSFRIKYNELQRQKTESDDKYSSEVTRHSSDIKQLADLKEEMLRIQTEFDELRNQRDLAQEHLKTGEDCWKNREQMLRTELSQLEEQVTNLTTQNTALHDQIQSLSTRLSINVLNQSTALSESVNADDSMTGVADSSILNRSLNDEEKHSLEQLLQIIKYLRKEKDLAVARFDVLRSENVRIQSEFMLLQKQLDETEAELKQMRENSDIDTVTVAKHQELLRTVETYNAITDSNRVLREERDTLNQKVRELTQHILERQNKLIPLEEKVAELEVKLESATNENTTLRMDVARQRQRMTTLVERSSKTNSDDWKRMQTERENLAKMLMAEKELLKHANEELNTHKVERTRLEAELNSVNKHLQTSNAQVKKLTDDLEATAAQTAELETLKAKLKTAEEQLTEVRIKESQIRKIAKRYKDSYTELKRQTDEREGDGAAGTAGTGGATAMDANASGSGTVAGGVAATEEGTAEVDDMRKQIESATEEIDTLKKENELLRAKLEKAERGVEVMKDAKNRILALTEQKNNAARELNAVKGLMQQQLDQMREETDMLKAQYEGRMTRCEKESADADRESKDAISRLTRENEQLTIRLNQLNRQLGLQQAVAKPTTSAVGAGVSDKPASESPRTANVKPMAGPSQQQSATVTPRRVSETPLASIRPMAVGSRTAAVLPTSQSNSTNVAIVQGSSASTTPAQGVGVSGGSVASNSNIAASTAASSGASTAGSSLVAGSSGAGGPTGAVSGTPSTSGLTTALVPPQQQQVHSATATSSSSSSTNTIGLNDSISSPTSSHTDYMPATSSASVAVAAVPPMGTASTSTAESSSSSSSSTSTHVESENAAQMSRPDDQAQQQLQQQQVQQAAVAMVMPHVEGSVGQQQALQQQSPQAHLAQQQQQSTVQPLQQQQPQQQQSSAQASSSNTVTTTQAGHKRPRDVEGDSSTDNAGQQLASKPAPAKKRIRMVQVATDGFQGVSESGLDVEYQVPTSSQRDQEDDIIVVDSEEEDEDDDDEEEEEDDVGMADEGTAEADDGPFDAYETEELGVAGGVGAYDEGEGPDIDEDNNIQSANNEVDVDEDEAPNPCGTTSTTSTSTSSTSSSSTLSGKAMPGQHTEPMDTTADAETSSTSSSTVPAGGSSVAVAGASTSTESSSAVESGASTSSTSGGNTSNDAQQLPQIQSTTGASPSEASVGQQSSSSSSSSAALPSSATSSSSSGTGNTAAQSQVAAASIVVGGSSVSTARQVVNPLSRQQQQAPHLMLMQQNYEHHESADDRIVPSTPTLYASRRTDGFNVGSPHPQVPTARFTFSETSTSHQSVGVVPTSGGGAGAVGLPEGIDDTRIDLSQLDEATAGGSSSGSGRSVPTTPQHTTHSTEHSLLGGLSATAGGPTSSGLNTNDHLSSGGGESQVPDILVSGGNMGDGYIPESTTSSSIERLHVSYSSEAQASSDTGSGALERSERELLEEDDDLVDGGDSRSMGAEANATLGGDDVDDDVDGDVDMEDHSSSTSTTTTTIAATTSAGKPKFGGPSSAVSSETTAAAAPSTSASTESPAAGSSAGTAQASGSASGSKSTSTARKNEADTGAGDDGVSSEGEHLNKSLIQLPMEESSEAEVLESPSSNTRSRSSSAQRVAPNVPVRRGGRRFNQRGANRTPITWNEGR
uniref:Nucleoprotein TPR n=1 Tax=Anopheles epiroticus TaxID=199890 RepID=A0A182NZD0_9DIPT